MQGWNTKLTNWPWWMALVFHSQQYGRKIKTKKHEHYIQPKDEFVS